MRRLAFSTAVVAVVPGVTLSAHEAMRFGDLATDPTAYEITVEDCEISTVFKDQTWVRTPWETSRTISAKAPLGALDLDAVEYIDQRPDRTIVRVPLVGGAPPVIHHHLFLAGPDTGIERLFNGEDYACSERSCAVFIDRDDLVLVAMGAHHPKTAVEMIAWIADHATACAAPS